MGFSGLGFRVYGMCRAFHRNLDVESQCSQRGVHQSWTFSGP